ncbi:MAG: trypsin-like peptidase domain-containing protein [Anaerolineales bacterium]|nr:trypsin-like peptidase domain-containing protein [Anaerolineales bacterium]
MKSQNINRFWFMFIVLALAALACQGGGGTTPTNLDQPNVPQDSGNNNNGLSQSERANLISATVQIYALFNQNGELTPVWSGSGTILNKSGLILTNAHVAAPTTRGEAADPDALAVALVQSEDKPPVFSYLAEVRTADGYLDMAVIQIVSTVDGDSIDTNSLNLPYVPLGDSDAVHVGDHVSVFGFPSIGGETITYTDGNVSGFTAEEQIGDRAWIKTDATISGGNSGGLAANDNAQIIGIPTIAASGADRDITDCRVVQDTNGDGQLTDQDTCIPIGGFINGIRPVNLAAPLIKAAQGGQAYVSPYGSGAAATESSTGQEKMSDITWYLTDKNDKLTDPVTSYDYGVSVLVATFDYSGFVNGESWADIWYKDGEKIYGDQYVWDQGESGNTFAYVNTTDGSPFAEGTYHVEISIDNGAGPLTQAEVLVGSGGSPNTPSQPNKADGVTIFGNVYDADSNNGLANAYVFVLNSGLTYDEWSNNKYPKSDVYSYTQTDSNGNYRIPDTLKRSTKYTIVASMKGYFEQYGDGLVWKDQDPAEYELNIGLSK